MNTEIFTVNPDGTALTNVTATDEKQETNPDWSPDGSRIVYSYEDLRGGVDTDNAIAAMNADGTGRTVLTANAPTRDDFLPAWSPDGAKIVFVQSRWFAETFDLFVMDSDGSNPTGITLDGHSWSPGWQPA